MTCRKAATLIFIFACGLGWLWLNFIFLKFDLSNHHELWSTYSIENFSWDGRRPLKVVFMTWGSRGDHQPNIALGLELARRGHHVTVMGMDKYRSLIERHPSLHYREIVDSHIWKLAEAFGDSEGADFIPLTKDYIIKSCREMVPQYIEAAKDADVLIGSHSAMLELQHLMVAEVVKKPLVFLTHDLTLPTAAYSFNAGSSRVQDYGRRINILNQRLFGIILGAALTFGPSAEVRSIRSELGLSTPWPFLQVLSPEHLADFPVFETRDPTLWPLPTDQPPHWYHTGYFVTYDEKRECPASVRSELQAWIDERKAQGRKVIYFGQGSFSHHAKETFTDILYDTLRALDVDGIALSSTVDDRTHAKYLKVIQELDQTDVFPQCEVIVHHGGAGSASQAIRSGRPSICLPSMPFQEVWGAKIEEYGAGALLLPDVMMSTYAQNKSNNLLTAAIQSSLQPTVKDKAAELGAKARAMSKAHGIHLAAVRIEYHLQMLMQKNHISHHDSMKNNDGAKSTNQEEL